RHASSRRPPIDPADRLLAWYDRHARALPWRAKAGERADPYRVWLSEIMLQQTTVVAVGPYFRDFLARWPTVHDLAAADLDAVLRAWRGLGYYARARNLHRCARVVSAEHGGEFPDSEEALRGLPGVGAYTAAAIAAIAFGRRATVMDGNVERVIARMFRVTEPLPRAKAAPRPIGEGLTPGARPGDYAQAMMALGAPICLPRKPKCMLCPLVEACAARRAGVQEALPAKLPKARRPKRHGVVLWHMRRDGSVIPRSHHE